LHWHSGANVKKLLLFILTNMIISIYNVVTKKTFYDTNILVPMLKNFFVFIAKKYYCFCQQ
jgi:hypothetical protein